MSPAKPKPKPKQSDKRRTVEEARRAFADRTAAMTAGYVFRLRYAWEAVAIGLPAIEALRLAEKSWDEIAAQLAAASGFPTISGQSVRVYRSRLKSDFYDPQLGRLGLRREGKVLLPLVADDEPPHGADPSGGKPEVPAETESDPKPDTQVATDAKEPDPVIRAGTSVPRKSNAGGSSPTSSAATRGRYALKSHPK